MCAHSDTFLDGDFLFFSEVEIAITWNQGDLEVARDFGSSLLGDRL